MDLFGECLPYVWEILHLIPSSLRRFFASSVPIEFLLIVLLAFAPLAYGAVDAWSELVVLSLVAAMTLCLALRLVADRFERIRWSWSYLPIVLFLALAVFQFLPLPAAWLAAISPQTAATRASLVGDLPGAAEALSFASLSLYPHATKHDLRLVFATAAVFFIVRSVYHRPEQVRRLLVGVAVIGGGIALLAFVQDLSGTDKIYGRVPIAKPANSGPFVNHSHYSQFMNLCIGAAFGLLLMKLHDLFPAGSDRRVADIWHRLHEPKARVLWWLAAMITLGAATIFLSLSRTGSLCLLVAGGLTALALASLRTLRGRSGVLLLVGIGVLVFLLYAGFDAVYDRLGTLADLPDRYADRWQILQDVAVIWSQFPLFGTGLGTHEVVYPMFESATLNTLASHAENEYAQVLEETGVAGLILLALFAAMIWFYYIRTVRGRPVPIQLTAFGLGYGLLAVMIHSFTDFGQHLPANAMLTAVLCGLLVNLAQAKESKSGRVDGTGTLHSSSFQGRGAGGQRIRVPRRLRTSVLFALALCALWVPVLLSANNAWAAERHWAHALAAESRVRAADWLASNDEYAELIGEAAAACDLQPDNVEYRLWLNYYRWRSISRDHDEEAGYIRLSPQALSWTRRIVSQLHAASFSGATYGPLHSFAGQLERFVLDNPAGAEGIRRGFHLSPNDPLACYLAGYLKAEEGDFEAAVVRFRRAIELDGSTFKDIVSFCLQLQRPDLAVDLAGDNEWRLLQLAPRLSDAEDHGDLSVEARAKVIALLKDRCQGDDATPSVLAAAARLCRRDGDHEIALAYYRRALGGDYGQVGWRLAYARTLAEQGQIDQAIHEARICLRLRPQLEAARRFISDLSVPRAENGIIGTQ